VCTTGSLYDESFVLEMPWTQTVQANATATNYNIKLHYSYAYPSVTGRSSLPSRFSITPETINLLIGLLGLRGDWSITKLLPTQNKTSQLNVDTQRCPEQDSNLGFKTIRVLDRAAAVMYNLHGDDIFLGTEGHNHCKHFAWTWISREWIGCKLAPPLLLVSQGSMVGSGRGGSYAVSMRGCWEHADYRLFKENIH
jgi:hypothetical protein